MEHNKIDRLLPMLLALSGSKNYSLKELSEKFGISERTVYRYLVSFENAGFILHRDNGYRLQTNMPAFKSLQKLLHFTEEEAFILYQTLEQIDGSSPLKERLIRKLNVLYDFHILRQQNPGMLRLIREIANAIERGRQVEIRGYRSSNSDTIANRRVEPFDFLPDYAAVWCYDTDSRSCKQFRISRMENVVMLPAQWQHREQHKLPFCDAFGMAAPMPADTIKLALSLKAYNLLLEEHPTAGETVTTAGSSYTLEIPVANYYGVGRFVLGLPGHIKVLGSAAFVSFLQEEAKKVWRGDGG